jgi:type I restriction enzyme S subunit
MSEWRETKLRNVVSILGDGLHGTPIYTDKGDYYFINGNNLSNGKIVFKKDTKRVSGEEYHKYKKPLNNRTILISINGTLGNIALYNNERCILGKSACYFNVIDSIDKQYIRYVVSTDDFQGYISQFANGTTIKNVSLQVVRDYSFLLPPLATQRAISEVLSSLDDKIDLLMRQNATLEALAQTYFRQWFVEGANEDWEEKGLDEIADFLNGLPLQKYPYKYGEPVYAIKIKELNSGYSDNSDICSADVPEKYIVNPGDVVFSWSGSLVVDIWKYGKGALNQHLFKVTSDKYPKWFYYYWIKYHLPEFRIIAESKATTMGHIQRGHLTAAKVLVPSDCELTVMDKTMQPLIEKIEQNNAQILTLQKLRDTLLPKLISGEVRVKQ